MTGAGANGAIIILMMTHYGKMRQDNTVNDKSLE